MHGILGGLNPTGAVPSARAPVVDLFGRQEAVEPFTIFDSKMIDALISPFRDWDTDAIDFLYFDYDPTIGGYRITADPFVLGSVRRKTFIRFDYRAGRTHQIIMTAIPGALNAGVLRELGYFDNNQGAFFRFRAAAHVVIRKNAVDTAVPQSAWNVDKFDGTGPSGITLDWTEAQIFTINFQWLGAGAVVFGFNVNGRNYTAHVFQNANNLTSTWSADPTLPLQFYVEADSTQEEAISLVQICATVTSVGDGATTPRTIYRNAALSFSANGPVYPLIVMRLRAGQYSTVIPIKISINVSSLIPDLQWFLLRSPVITGAGFSYTGLSNSAVEFNNALTTSNVVALGASANEIPDTGYLLQSAAESNGVINLIKPLRPLGRYIVSDVSETFVLAFRKFTGTGTETVWASMTFTETI